MLCRFDCLLNLKNTVESCKSVKEKSAEILDPSKILIEFLQDIFVGNVTMAELAEMCVVITLRTANSFGHSPIIKIVSSNGGNMNC